MNPAKELVQRARSHPDRTALIFHDRPVSFGELERRAGGLARALRARGVSPGDAVAWLLPNGPDFVACYFATLALGAIGVPLDVRMSTEDARAILEHAGARLAVVTSEWASRLPGCLAVEDLREGAPLEVRERSEDEEALYMYTSGSTGAPKGVVLTFRNFNGFLRFMEHFGFADPEGTFLLWMPMSHISGPIFCNELVRRGCRLAVLDHISPRAILGAVGRHRVVGFHGVPTVVQALLRHPRWDRYDLRSLRWIALMGMAVNPHLVEELARALPHVAVVQGYGLTETASLVTVVPLQEAERKRASIGRPIPGAELRVVDAEGQPLGPGQVGEILVRGDMVMKGYLRDPEATARRMRGGWLHTGDLGWYDEDGYYYFAGRADEMIVTGGMNVYPAEVEGVIARHPRVQEVAVVGVPHPERGQVIKAVVVGQVSAEEVLSFCRRHLAPYKVPRVVEVRPELPRTRTGKVAKGLL